MINKISPALSKIETRIKSLQTTQRAIQDKEYELNRLQENIESTTWLLDELKFDERVQHEHITELVEEALSEGFTKEYIDRFLKERKYKK